MSRLEALRGLLEENRLDAVLVSQPENRVYLSGFTGTAGLLIVSLAEAILATDSRYYLQVEEEAPEFELERVGYELHERLVGILQRLGATRVGYEDEHVTVGELSRLEAVTRPAEIELVSMGRLVGGLRAVKSAEEIGWIHRAVEITDEAMAHVWRQLRRGVTEADVSWEIRAQFHARGVDELAFESIVASGANSAKPHYRSGDDNVQPGAPLLIDMGAKVGGYCADLTRTVILDGAEDDRFREIHAVVLGAQQRAEEALRPGMTGGELDAVARGVIEQAGFGEAFGHGLGHGVGLAVHEPPILRRGSEDVLQPGMVVTIEPGIYLAGWGGVRMEDVVVVTEDGGEVLTTARRDPLAVA